MMDVLKIIMKGANEIQMFYGVEELVSLLHGDDELFQKYNFYGELAGFNREKISELIHYLIDDGFLSIFGLIIKVISITPKGQLLLNHADDSTLEEQIKSLRKQLAQSERLPRFIIFSNKTIRDLCIIRPINHDQLTQVSGFGPKKIEKYGQDILDLITKHNLKTKESLKLINNKVNQNKKASFS